MARAEERAASIAEFPITGLARPKTLAQMRAFARWCRSRRIAVLHTTDVYANIFGLPAAWFAGVPVRIGTRREINPGKSTAMIAAQRVAYGFSTHVVANSVAAAARLAEERVGQDKIEVIPNGLALDRFPRRNASARPRRIITVANLRQEKAHDVLLKAARQVLSRCPDAEFWLVGGGVREQALRALAAELGLEGRVRFFGHRDDVPALLAQCDIFALPSRSEAMPNGVLEAMAAGLPVVATRVGGIPELLSPHTGILIPVDDDRALADGITTLIEAPERAAELGRAARQFVTERFSFERMVNSFEQLFESSLSRATAPSPLAHSEIS